MEISLYTAIKLIGVIYSLTKDSPLKKTSKNELEAACREINNLKYDKYPRECLNRTLGHLESAFSHFEPSTWNFLDDEDRLLWDQRTYKNEICLLIAVIHSYLGNNSRAKTWLSEELSEYGWISMPEGALDLLGMESIEEFFEVLYEDDGKTYKQLEWSTKIHNDEAYDNSGYNPFDSYVGF